MQIKSHIKRCKFIIRIILLFSILIFMFYSSSILSESVKSSMTMCAETIIPSIFPMLILSEIICQSSLTFDLSKIFSLPLQLIFGVSKPCCFPIILGSLCGYPSGAIAVKRLYENNEISKSEAERLLMFVNNPSFAYIIGALGISVFSSEKIGVIIYICVFLASVCAGVFSRFFFGKKEEHINMPIFKDNLRFSNILTNSVSKSALNMLNICAYIILFSCICDGIMSFEFISILPSFAKSLICGFFEISKGIFISKNIENDMLKMIICTIICSWSGICVQMQIISVCKDCGFSFTPFIVSKFIQSVLSPAFLLIYVKFVAKGIIKTGDFNFNFLSDNVSIKTFILLFFIISLTLRFIKNKNDTI